MIMLLTQGWIGGTLDIRAGLFPDREAVSRTRHRVKGGGVKWSPAGRFRTD